MVLKRVRAARIVSHRLPAATRAVTLQVGIRAREWNIPAKSPSHADRAVAPRLGLPHLPLRGQRRTRPCGVLPASRFTPWPCRPKDS